MPPALVVNSETGFLTSPNSFSSFTNEKKLKFIELSNEISRNQGIIPNINDLCKLIDIHPATFYGHLNRDPEFANAWKQCLLNVEAHLQTKMTEFAQRPGNYMDRITALRRIAPERWNPEYKVTQEVTINTSTVDKLKAYDAELIDDNLTQPNIVNDCKVLEGSPEKTTPPTPNIIISSPDKTQKEKR